MGGSEEIGDGFGAGTGSKVRTGSEVDGVGVEVGVDAGVTCGENGCFIITGKSGDPEQDP